MIEKQWLKYELKPTNKKTKTYAVKPISADYELGEIKWYAPWRHYCFFPTQDLPTVHSDRCLFQISQFITKLNCEHRIEVKDEPSI